MTEGNNPEEKPSFFDFSEEEARSWPPANSYEIEDETEEVSDTVSPAAEPEEFDPLTIVDPVLANDEPEILEDKSIDDNGSQFVDMLFTDFGSFNDVESEPSLSPEPVIESTLVLEELAPVESPLIESPIQHVEHIIQPPVKDEKQEQEDREALDAILGAFVIKPQIANVVNKPEQSKPEQNKPELKLPEVETSDDFDIDSMLSSPSISIQDDEMTDVRDINVSEAIEEYDINSVIDEQEQSALPFRTYSAFDYNEETLTEASLDEAEEKQGLKLNRNILIVLAVLLLVGGWYGFQSLFNRKIPGVANARRRKPPKKEQKSLLAISRELIPVWEITNQKSITDSEERKIVNDIYSESGRDNPFMMPDSVLADLKRVADAQIASTKAPKSYRRKAYRATLVGVLTAKDSTIALINYQEAVFDVLEGTSRPKILKLATKAMDKAKANTQEMVIGSYIGPWQITRMDSPKDAFTEAKVHLINQGQVKTLSMGRAEELGIFDTGGDIDNLDSPSEEDEFDSDASDPAAAADFEF